jgi:hypothetical protein
MTTEDRVAVLEQHVRAAETHRHALEVLLLSLMESVPIREEALEQTLGRLRREVPSEAAEEVEIRVMFLLNAAARR